MATAAARCPAVAAAGAADAGAAKDSFDVELTRKSALSSCT